MKLVDLKPQFLKSLPDKCSQYVNTLEEANGILFLCPKCFEENKGRVGTHSVLCWFKDRGVPDDLDPKPGRWNPQGTGYSDLTFVGPGATSILLTSGCQWHGFIVNGGIE